jgi:hypothetical protein
MRYKYLFSGILLLLFFDCKKNDVPPQSYWSVNTTKYYANHVYMNQEQTVMDTASGSTLIAIDFFRNIVNPGSYKVLTTPPYAPGSTPLNYCQILISINGSDTANYWSIGQPSDSVYVSVVNGKLEISFKNISLKSSENEIILSSGFLEFTQQ